MQTKTQSPRFLRRRRFFLVLPLLALPFTTLMFWAMGGGKGSGAEAGQTTPKGGLNMQLPDAYLKDDKSLNKLSYYEKAASDAQKLHEQLKNDPYYGKGNTDETLMASSDTAISPMTYNKNVLGKGLNTSPYNADNMDPNEAKVYNKLSELNKALNGATSQTTKRSSYPNLNRSGSVAVNSADVDRLERMMNMTRNEDNSEDPEMKQLSGMMDKILDIQHPERIKEKFEKKNETVTANIYSVQARIEDNNPSLVTNNPASSETRQTNSSPSNGFFSLVDDMENATETPNSISAVIHETQTVVDGAVVKLRLTSDVFVNGALVPKGSFVFGTTTLNGERLTIKINSIRYKSSLFPVQLSVVDMDGMDGVYVPGAITRDVAKNSADRAIQGIGIATLDPSLKAQAASAGIEAAKTLLSKKAKLIKVILKAGYQVYLQDEKTKGAS
ncbi:conjugative transposon protein TraM [Paracnuella aquatica]|uniref:conjugative transposon protein TraM n=1 Tax=Paracnuella aquatica TaxID=2268757 RepID=UPI000DEEBD11|nr:conjugative transposon protein TraM [Paracnuella aquatica]RPD44053.1 conjugative transposon protein TraM [Paracnuella aquatica]